MIFFIIISSLNQISPENIAKLSFVVAYFMCTLTEIFVSCYFGTLTMVKSDIIATKAFESNWIQQDQKYKQALCILVTRTSRPIHLYVNKVFSLDLTTFLKVNEYKIKISFFP